MNKETRRQIDNVLTWLVVTIAVIALAVATAVIAIIKW